MRRKPSRGLGRENTFATLQAIASPNAPERATCRRAQEALERRSATMAQTRDLLRASSRTGAQLSDMVDRIKTFAPNASGCSARLRDGRGP
ncbi:HWE histidine kinase domain-containing protein [Bradyrhizobium symbiodeficiens]|uniref:HWE histidine kinase domain-containing protein n=1 Tax=Bradyrhizobium symbiodeficiens TaxID=1404367 RepID=UPI003BAF1F72